MDLPGMKRIDLTPFVQDRKLKWDVPAGNWKIIYLRWMIRNDNRGVDFGIWKTIPPSILSCPLDIHSGNVARKLGLLSNKHDSVNESKSGWS